MTNYIKHEVMKNKLGVMDMYKFSTDGNTNLSDTEQRAIEKLKGRISETFACVN